MTAITLTDAPTVRLRLTPRGRRVLTGIAAFPIVLTAAVALLWGGMDAVATSRAASVDFTYVTVHSGETLWAIAERVAPASDPRDVIAEVMNLNGLSTSSVQPGQRIALPLSYTD